MFGVVIEFGFGDFFFIIIFEVFKGVNCKIMLMTVWSDGIVSYERCLLMGIYKRKFYLFLLFW